MNRHFSFLALLVGVLVVALCAPTFAQKTGSLSGVIKDAQTGVPLPGANVILTGTSMGAATDIGGKYIIRNIPAGTYTLRVAYVGFTTLTIPVVVAEDEEVRHDLTMQAVAIEGETVIVTAQAAGQNAAINQQLSSAQITNVVSAARIQELPDANAAESIGRLPGIAVLRSAHMQQKCPQQRSRGLILAQPFKSQGGHRQLLPVRR